MISYYSARGGISIAREEGRVENESRSTIIIRDGGTEDQGTYSCRPLTGDFRSASTRLFLDQSTAHLSSAHSTSDLRAFLPTLLLLLTVLL